MNSTCRPATSHFFLVKLCYAPPGSWLQCCAHVSQNEDEAPGAGLALGQQEGVHLVPALGHGAVGEGLARHEVHAGLGQLLVEGEQRLSLVRLVLRILLLLSSFRLDRLFAPSRSWPLQTASKH